MSSENGRSKLFDKIASNWPAAIDTKVLRSDVSTFGSRSGSLSMSFNRYLKKIGFSSTQKSVEENNRSFHKLFAQSC